MSGGSTVARVWLQAIVCGAGCGASFGVGVLLVATAIDHRGYTTLGLVLGIPVLSFYAGVIGGLVGLVIGVPTGLIAGLTLEASLRRMTPRAATWTTAMVVLAAQVAAGIALVEVPRWGTLWAFAVVPAITAFPLAREVGRAARDAAMPSIDRRDTLTA